MKPFTLKSILAAMLLSAAFPVVLAQDPTPHLTKSQEQWIAVLKSPDASQKDKADACRELAVLGTKDAVPALAALLPDEKYNHMARYALETIPDPSVDDALRVAVTNLTGRPLVGVIGSIGVRRDGKAIVPLAKHLRDADAEVAQAAARALGKIGTAGAAKALEVAVKEVPAGNQLAVCEGLFRCAEALTAKGQKKEALAIYDQLRSLPNAPHQVRAGALRGAILARGKDGLKLMQEALRGDDYILTAAAARTAMEMPGPEVTSALTEVLSQLSADKQILVIQTFGKRADAAALPALFAATKSGPAPVRVAAVRALPEIGQASAVPVLVALMSDSESAVAKAAQESLAGLSGPAVDAAVTGMLASTKTSDRLAAIDLIGRRRMVGCVPDLLKAAGDADAQVRPAALKRVGELGTPAQMPALLALLGKATSSQDLDAAEQAVSAVCERANDPAGCTAAVAGMLPQAQPGPKGALLRVLTTIGGPDALKAVRAAVNDSNADVHAAAVRSLGAWKTPDAAPELLALAQAASSPTEKMLCLRSYLGWAANPDLPADKRLAMCQQAAGLIQTTDEKKLLLGALGSIKTVESLAVVGPYLSDGATKQEAGAAVVAIAEDLLKGGSAAQVASKLIEPLQKAAEAGGSAELTRKAKSLAEQAQKKAAGK